MLKKVKLLFNTKVAKNSIWIIVEQVFQMVMSLVIGIASARFLGVTNYGSLNYTASFVSFFTAVATLGMEGVVIKKMIEEPEKEGEILGSGIAFRLISSLLSSASIVLIVWALNPNDSTKIFLAILQSFQLYFTAIHILDSWFQRYLKSKYVSIAKMIACFIVSIYKIILLITAQSIEWFAFSNSLTSLIVALILFLMYRKQKKQKLTIRVSTGKEILSNSYHFIISGLMVAIYGQMDKIMIGSMISDRAVGYYTTAAILCSCWTFVPNAIINSSRPQIMEIKNNGYEDNYIRRLEQLYSIVIWICIIASIAVCLFGKWAVAILYGNEYLGAVAPLQVLIWSETFAMIGTARTVWILSENKNQYVKYYIGIGAGVNIVLNFAFIPKMGEVGAAFATLITQIITGIIAPMFFKETRIHTKYVMDAFLLKWYWGRTRS